MFKQLFEPKISYFKKENICQCIVLTSNKKEETIWLFRNKCSIVSSWILKNQRDLPDAIQVKTFNIYQACTYKFYHSTQVYTGYKWLVFGWIAAAHTGDGIHGGDTPVLSLS